jgi:predicted Rossmann-fold nucleotide-binding protein
LLNKDFPHVAAILEAGNFMRTLFDVSRDLVNKTTYERAVSRIAPVFEEIQHLIEDARRMKAEGELTPRALTEAELEASEMVSEEASA